MGRVGFSTDCRCQAGEVAERWLLAFGENGIFGLGKVLPGGGGGGPFVDP